MKRRKPDFLGIGVQRSGTTFLQNCLGTHPQIGKPKRGLHFFSHDSKYNDEIKFISKNDFSWYERQLGIYDDKKAVGEFSVSYTFPEYIENASYQIQTNYPDVRLIIAIRNPVDRLISEYRRLSERFEIKAMTQFEEFLENHKNIIERGDYGKILKIFLSRFSKEQLHIKIFEDLRTEPVQYISSLYEFLEVEKNFKTSEIKINPNPSCPRTNSILGKITNTLQSIGSSLTKNKVASPLANRIRDSFVWRKVKESSIDDATISQDVREQIFKIYKDEIFAVEELLSRKLVDWK